MLYPVYWRANVRGRGSLINLTLIDLSSGSVSWGWEPQAVLGEGLLYSSLTPTPTTHVKLGWDNRLIERVYGQHSPIGITNI